MDSVTLKTKLLKDALAKASRCTSKDAKYIIETAVCIKLENRTLEIESTDGNILLNLKYQNVVDDPAMSFFATTDCAKLAKFISKISGDTVSIIVEPKGIKVVHKSGEAILPIITAQDGGCAVIPKIAVDKSNKITLPKEALDRVRQYNTKSIYKDDSQPLFTGYCFEGSSVTTYNKATMCNTKIDATLDKKVLMSKDMVALFDIIPDAFVDMYFNDSVMAIIGDGISIIGPYLDGVDSYGNSKIIGYLDRPQFSNTIIVNRKEFIEAVDRVGLFVNELDHGVIGLAITDDDIQIIPKSGQSVEHVLYKSADSGVEIKQFALDINDLTNIISTISGETITFKYGDITSIMIDDMVAKQAVSLVQ